MFTGKGIELDYWVCRFVVLLLGMRETRPHLNNILKFFSFLCEFLEALISVNDINE